MEALEGLRGVLAVHVLIHHTNVLPPYNFFTAMAMLINSRLSEPHTIKVRPTRRWLSSVYTANTLKTVRINSQRK